MGPKNAKFSPLPRSNYEWEQEINQNPYWGNNETQSTPEKSYHWER